METIWKPRLPAEAWGCSLTGAVSEAGTSPFSKTIVMFVRSP
jgi:hypothetical protein